MSSLNGCSVRDKQKNTNKEKNEVVMANQDFMEVDSMQDSIIKLRMLKYQLSSKIVKDSIDGETLTRAQLVFLVILRELCNTQVNSLSDLLKSFYVGVSINSGIEWGKVGILSIVVQMKK